MQKLTPIEIYERLFAVYGPQHWWPAETPFEVMVGAILTQNTSWQNVESAISNLKTHDMLHCEAIVTSDLHQLAEIIRSSGAYLQKARYLQHFSLFYIENGKRSGLIKRPQSMLRKQLLALYGIGPETADSILLYALDKPVFVIDAYTKRLFVRLEHFDHQLAYDNIQHYFQQRLPESLPLFQEFHALIVAHAKRYCRTKPLCGACPLLDHCPTAACSTLEISRTFMPDVG